MRLFRQHTTKKEDNLSSGTIRNTEGSDVLEACETIRSNKQWGRDALSRQCIMVFERDEIPADPNYPGTIAGSRWPKENIFILQSENGVYHVHVSDTVTPNYEMKKGLPTIKVERGSQITDITYHPPKTMFTSVTVGGVTTGGFSTTKDYISYNSKPGENGYLYIDGQIYNRVYLNEKVSEKWLELISKDSPQQDYYISFVYTGIDLEYNIRLGKDELRLDTPRYFKNKLLADFLKSVPQMIRQGNRCKVCGKEFSDSDNRESIGNTKMCIKCYRNYKKISGK